MKWSDAKPKGILFVISAPSGTGKTTLIQELMKEVDGLSFSVSYTTRRPRPGEVQGRDYHFVSRKDFLRMADEGRFLEWAEVHGDLYGTPLESLYPPEGTDMILDIDPQGAKKVRQMRRDAVLIFIVPPSLEELERRLRKRGKDSEEAIKGRLKDAREELAQIPLYDYIVVNDQFGEALRCLSSIIRAERCKMERVVKEVGNGADNR
ncbi:MAG TPA: guanylate kinase [Deltaproteobacteria bacterium]|nr:guanylate kinase [Deltaproteobacteria bacterium]